jgi:hypothetical protein
MGEGSNFYYQHDARLHDNDTRITIFDNAGVEGSPAEPEARGIELQLDMQTMTASLVQAYPAPFGNISGSQGSLQLLDNGNFLAGWGVSLALNIPCKRLTGCSYSRSHIILSLPATETSF